MKTRIPMIVAAALGLAGLASCGESPQVVMYEQGEYQGKPDSRPWESAAFGGNRQAWENALQNRAQAQNEYRRSE